MQSRIKTCAIYIPAEHCYILQVAKNWATTVVLQQTVTYS